jgi:hypothetical protein
MMAGNIEEKIVFGLSPSPGGDGVMLLLGVPKGAWEYMKDGKTHHFDLSSVGVPIKLIMYGAETHDAAIKVIEEHNRSQGIAHLDERRRDFSIKDKSA